MKRLSIIVILCAAFVALLMIARRDRSAPGKNEATAPLAPPVVEAAPVTLADAVRESVVVKVSGQVRSPGTFQLATPTLVEALRRGIPTALADMKKITVLRPGPGGGVEKIVIDTTATVGTGASDMTLKTGDAIFVPEVIL